jgi:branched-chain amino acid transport system permease protein
MGAALLRRAAAAGAIGGGVTVYLAMVGLLMKFTELELVGTSLTFSRVLLLLPAALAAIVVARPHIEKGSLAEAGIGDGAAGGLVAGAVAGGVGGAFVLVVDAVGVDRVRQIFIQVTQALLDFMSFEVTPLVAGAFVLLVASALVGTFAGALRAAPLRIRSPIAYATFTVLLMGMLQRIVPIALDELGVERDWLYSKVTGGLTWGGAIIVFVVVAALRAWAMGPGVRFRTRMRAASQERSEVRLSLLLLALLFLLVVPQLFGSVISETLGTVQVYLLLGIGLNIIVGYAGLLNLGFVVFFLFGAYATALLTGASINTFTGAAAPAFSLDLNFYVAIPIVALLAAGLGALTAAPALRLRGDYLALVTLGLGQVGSVLIASPWLTPLVGGPQGMTGVTNAAIGGFGFRDPQHFYYLALAFVLLSIFVSWRLSSSRVGRAWTAMREDEQIADAWGVSPSRYKLLAFAIGGAIGSLGGALFAVKTGSLSPASFEILVSITALGIVILGGIGSLPGVVVGALVLIGLPGLLREFEEYRLLVYGAALVGIMILRPQGLVPNVRRERELQDEEKAQDAWQSIFERSEAEQADAGPGEVST